MQDIQLNLNFGSVTNTCFRIMSPDMFAQNYIFLNHFYWKYNQLNLSFI